MTVTYWCERALVGDVVRERVAIGITGDHISMVTPDVDPPPAATRLGGITIPGLANAHSHAFHRALRSRTQVGRGSFWTWRDQMYQAALALTPDSYHRLARATFAEMALAGIVVVGEFHYVHHQPGGDRYDNANAMGEALISAARDAGIRITLLDTLYLHGGIDNGRYVEPNPAQARFSDGTAEQWVDRVDALGDTPLCRIGAAIHSVRAVDPAAVATAVAWVESNQAPIHAHVSEQPAENVQSQAAHGATPTEVLHEAGALDASFTAV
ncbi:MAG: formimidoylglutamate deiminase, partial [Acidimicrobiales bacterium]